MVLQAPLGSTADTVTVEGRGHVEPAAVRALELLACVPDLGPLPALKPAPWSPLVAVAETVGYEGSYWPFVIVATLDEGPGEVLGMVLGVIRSSPSEIVL